VVPRDNTVLMLQIHVLLFGLFSITFGRPYFGIQYQVPAATSTVVGNAKVMSYEDIEEARGKRVAKEAANEAAQETATASGKRGRKRKSPAPVRANGKKARRSEVEVVEDEVATAGLGDHCSVLQF
jgi:hypothetical protein